MGVRVKRSDGATAWSTGRVLRRRLTDGGASRAAPDSTGNSGSLTRSTVYDEPPVDCTSGRPADWRPRASPRSAGVVGRLTCAIWSARAWMVDGSWGLPGESVGGRLNAWLRWRAMGRGTASNRQTVGR